MYIILLYRVLFYKVEYQKKQEPRLVTTGQHMHTSRAIISLSRDGRTVAIGSTFRLDVFNGLNGELVQTINYMHSGASSHNPSFSLEFAYP